MRLQKRCFRERAWCLARSKGAGRVTRGPPVTRRGCGPSPARSGCGPRRSPRTGRIRQRKQRWGAETVGVAIFGVVKASNPTASTYRLTISQLSIAPDLTCPLSFLTDVVLLAQAFVPTMDGYAKVYSEIRRNLGVYTRLCVFAVGKATATSGTSRFAWRATRFRRLI